MRFKHPFCTNWWLTIFRQATHKSKRRAHLPPRQTETISASLESPPKQDSSPLGDRRTPFLIQLHPSSLAENLHQAIDGEDGKEVRAELRKLIERVDFIPVEGLGKFQLEVHGSLAMLLALGRAQTAESPEAYAIGAL